MQLTWEEKHFSKGCTLSALWDYVHINFLWDKNHHILIQWKTVPLKQNTIIYLFLLETTRAKLC